MHADLMLLYSYLLYLWIMIYYKENLGKIAINLITIFF